MSDKKYVPDTKTKGLLSAVQRPITNVFTTLTFVESELLSSLMRFAAIKNELFVGGKPQGVRRHWRRTGYQRNSLSYSFKEKG